MKRKLLVTVGAGASIDFGLPSVGKVDEILSAHASTVYPLAPDPSSNLYAHVRDAIQAYYDQEQAERRRKRVNFEEVLYQLNLLAPHLSDPLRHHGSNALLSPRALPNVSEFGRAERPVDGDVLRTLVATLMDHLVENFIDECATLPSRKAAEFAELGGFLALLRDEFDVGILSLNYDDVFLKACPGLHTGFHAGTGRFEPLSVLARDAWDFIYHLHGSIHFAMRMGSFDMHRIAWAPTPEKGHPVQAFGRSTETTTEGTSFPTSPIVAGYGKTQQILRQPFRTYFAQVNRLVQEADAFMFVGYGFGDLHLNAAFSEARDRVRPTLVLDWAGEDQDSLRFRNDLWSYNLLKTFPAEASMMTGPGGARSVAVDELKAANEVERSSDPDLPLAIWYGGLIEACRHPGKLLPHLR